MLHWILRGVTVQFIKPHNNCMFCRSGEVSGYSCSRWNEPDDGKWQDNYLCGRVSTGKSGTLFTNIYR